VALEAYARYVKTKIADLRFFPLDHVVIAEDQPRILESSLQRGESERPQTVEVHVCSETECV
jgi:hypothetical protein